MQAKLYQGTSRVVMIDYTPGSAVSAGEVVVQGDAPMVAHIDIVANRQGALALCGGIYQVAADGAIGILKRVFWDNSANKVTLTASGNKPFGWTITAAAADGDLIYVYHDPGDSATKQAATVAALGTTTDLTAIAGSYADLAAARTSVNTLRTDVEARLDAIEAKIDATLASLKAAGLMA